MAGNMPLLLTSKADGGALSCFVLWSERYGLWVRGSQFSFNGLYYSLVHEELLFSCARRCDPMDCNPILHFLLNFVLIHDASMTWTTCPLPSTFPFAYNFSQNVYKNSSKYQYKNGKVSVFSSSYSGDYHYASFVFRNELAVEQLLQV